MSAPHCPQCATPLPDGDGALCPRCLMSGFLLHESDGEPLGSVRFGDYELRERVASGGMGVVYQAWHTGLRRLVALKMLKSGRLADAAERQRFAIEAEAVAQLDHPGILPIYEVGENEGQPFYTMRLVEGGRSGADLSRAQPVDFRRVAETLAAVARAVHFAHQRGILHRDLKPANILLDDAGSPFIVDFGLAKFTDSTAGLTVSGAVLGTPAYMAPEVAAGGSRAATVAADVYSLGTLLYEWTTGRPPFAAETTMEMLRRIAHEEPTPPSTLSARLPRDLETICLKCLEKVPARRYASAEALAEDLERWQRHEPVLARRTGRFARLGKWSRRHPAGAALAMLALAAAGVFFWMRAAADRDLRREVVSTNAARDRAESAERYALESKYASDINLAARQADIGDHATAWRSLAAYQPGEMVAADIRRSAGIAPAAAASADLRGFEWRWLWPRAKGDARAIFHAHKSWVNTVAWSRDGRFVASAGADGVVCLWDAVHERLLTTLVDPDNANPPLGYTDLLYELPKPFLGYSAAFSPDSGSLVTCSSDALRLWDIESRRERWTFRTSGLRAAVFSPTQASLALTLLHSEPTGMTVLDAATGKATALLATGRADAMCFSPDGRQFARWDAGDRRAWIQSIPGGEVVTSFPIDIKTVNIETMAFTPDGRRLAAANSEAGPVEVFDVATGQRTGQLVTRSVHTSDALATSPDNRMIAFGGTGKNIRLFDLDTQADVRRLRGHRAGIRALAFSPDGRRLVSGGYDGSILFWDVEPPARPPNLTNVFGPFAFSPDGLRLVTQNNQGTGTATLWELPTRRKVREWGTPPFQSAVFLTDGTLIIASTGSSHEPPCVRVFAHAGSESDESPGSVLTLLPGSLAACSAIALSPDGQYTVTGHTDGTLAFRETRTARLLHTEHRALSKSVGYSSSQTIATINPLVFSADGRTLAAISFDAAEVGTWTLPEFRLLGRRAFGANYEIPLAISPDGRQLALGGLMQGTTVNVWDTTLREAGIRLVGLGDYVNTVAWSPDGRTLAGGERGAFLKLWNLPTERDTATPVIGLPGTLNFAQVTFSPDGTWLGVSDTGGNLRLFHAPASDETDAAR